jgi:antitoxin component YwqK of YwqJK toxin-antitoxin module
MTRYLCLFVSFLFLFSTVGFAKTIKRHYPDGTIEAVVSKNKKGIRNGPYKTYWPNGKIKEKGRYKNGKQIGIAKQWDMDGNFVDNSY